MASSSDHTSEQQEKQMVLKEKQRKLPKKWKILASLGDFFDTKESEKRKKRSEKIEEMHWERIKKIEEMHWERIKEPETRSEERIKKIEEMYLKIEEMHWERIKEPETRSEKMEKMESKIRQMRLERIKEPETRSEERIKEPETRSEEPETRSEKIEEMHWNPSSLGDCSDNKESDLSEEARQELEKVIQTEDFESDPKDSNPEDSDPEESEEQNNHFYFHKFQAERSGIYKDIKDFVYMVLICCSKLEREFGSHVVLLKFTKTSETLHSLIKSLCLIHALYGYPDETATSLMDENAVRTLVEELKVKDNDGEKKGLVHYCRRAADSEFWQFEFSNGTCSLENLLREPAYIFLEVVRNLFPDWKKAPSFGRGCLKALPEVNCLKPAVWAEHKKKPECYGVSLGVRPFVRPLYLYTKLRRLKYVEDGQLSLKDTKLLKMKRLNDAHRTPCVGCQCFFGMSSFPPFGNCAEFDVIGNVKPDLLQTNQWEEFKSACQQHLNAFNNMLGMLREAKYPYEQILKIYFENTMNSKILKYQWNPEEKDFQLTLENWLPPVPTGQTQEQLERQNQQEQLKEQTELQRMAEKDTKRLMEQLERQNQRFEAQLKISDSESGKNEQENWQMEQEKDREQEKLICMLQEQVKRREEQLKEQANISRILKEQIEKDAQQHEEQLEASVSEIEKNEQENWQMEQEWDTEGSDYGYDTEENSYPLDDLIKDIDHMINSDKDLMKAMKVLKLRK